MGVCRLSLVGIAGPEKDFNTEITVVTEATLTNRLSNNRLAPVTSVTPVLKSFAG